jgi:riboflavin biosynthesis pyrimidine reductase
LKKPYVIIHTLTSLGGKINAIDLPEFDVAALQYEQLALHADTHLQDNLVDEVSILMAPVADASPDTPSLFLAKEPLSTPQPRSFALLEVKSLEGGTVWLRYKVNKGKTQ